MYRPEMSKWPDKDFNKACRFEVIEDEFIPCRTPVIAE